MLKSIDKQSVKDDDRKNMNLEQLGPESFIRNPYVLEFLDLKDYPKIHENDLEEALLNNFKSFLLELGKGFCFVARQKRIRIGKKIFMLT